MGTFTCEERRMVNPRFTSSDRNSTLVFRVWGGLPWISINGLKDSSRIFSKNIKYEELFMLGKIMQEFMKSEPGKEHSLVYNAYNFREKKKTMEFIFILRKDEKSVYHIILKVNGNAFDFPILMVNNLAYGTGDIPDADRSRYAMGMLVSHILNVMPIECQMTSFPSDKPSNGSYNRSNGGNSNYNSQGDFKQKQSYASSSDDDIFSQE